MEKQFIEDQQEFEDEWSEVEIKFNLSLCYVGMKVHCCSIQMHDKVLSILEEFSKSSERGKNWDQFIDLLLDLRAGKVSVTKHIELDTF